MNNISLEYFKFITNANAPTISDVYRNEKHNTLEMQVSGSAVGLVIAVEGRVQPDSGEWFSLVHLNKTTLEPDVTEGTTDITPLITENGIYQIPIEGVAEFRIRIVNISGGFVNVGGVMYDTADGDVIPKNYSLGSYAGNLSRLIVKGVPEAVFIEPESGNIVGYDRVADTSEVSIKTALQLVEGGFGNKVISALADSATVSGTYTSKVFSLESRALALGSYPIYGSAVPYCEKLKPVNGVFSLSKSASKDLGTGLKVCHIRPHNTATWSGIAYEIDDNDRVVTGFDDDTEYDVEYFIQSSVSKLLELPSQSNPKILTIQIKHAVYAFQGESVNQSNFVGWLYFIVPKAIFGGEGGMTAGQTTTADTVLTWKALTEREDNLPSFGEKRKPNPLAYYVFVPCGNSAGNIKGIVVTGNGISLQVGRSCKLPIKFVRSDDALVQPDYSQLNYKSDNTNIATIDENGTITAIGEGKTYVYAYLGYTYNNPISVLCEVNVTGVSRLARTSASQISL